MIPHNIPQQRATVQNKHSLADATLRLAEQQMKAAPLTQHWVCTGCGTVHTRMLPEECAGCGATALEFDYSSSSAKQANL